jgi:hypothetical protein
MGLLVKMSKRIESAFRKTSQDIGFVALFLMGIACFKLFFGLSTSETIDAIFLLGFVGLSFCITFFLNFRSYG